MNLIAKFTKRPVTIDAVQFADDADTISNIHAFLGAETSCVSYEDPKNPVFKIETLEGTMTAQVGDWIIKGVSGEFYPCKPDIFEKTYVRAVADDFKTRLLVETQETAERLNKLNAFMGNFAFPLLPREDKDLLYSQQRAMSEYVQILGKRLERAQMTFEHKAAHKQKHPGQTCHLCGAEGYACEHIPGVDF